MMVSAPLSAADQQKAGLWETTVTVKFGAGAPQIPPEAMAQMKKMGIKIPGVEPIVQKVCITPEQALQDKIPNGTNPDSGCEVKNSKRDGNRFTADMVCSGHMKGEGNMVMTLENSEHYNGNVKFKGVGADGRQVETATEISGRWLGTDCQGIAPYNKGS
jgi:hypothetical protein